MRNRIARTWTAARALPIALAILIGAAAAGPSLAEDTAGDAAESRAERLRATFRAEREDGDHKSREFLEQVLLVRAAEELALDDEQTVLLVRRYTESRKHMYELRKRRAEEMQALDALLRESPDGPGIDAALEALRAIDQELHETRQESFERMGAGLTPWQRAQLYLFIADFENELRRWVMEMRRERAGRNVRQKNEETLPEE